MLVRRLLRRNDTCRKLQAHVGGHRRVIIADRYYSKYRRSDDDDAIEAEIVDDKSAGATKATNTHSNSSSTSEWDISRMGNFLSRGFNRAKELVGLDEKSVQKRERRRIIDTEIDKTLGGTGLLGAVVGRLLKTVAHRVSESVHEVAHEVAAITECTEVALLQDSRIRSLLTSLAGNSSWEDGSQAVRCVPFSTAIREGQVREGKDEKRSQQCSVSMHVLPGGGEALSNGGGQSLGTVSVEAFLSEDTGSISLDRVKFKSMLFQPTGGKVWKIDCDNLPNVREINL